MTDLPFIHGSPGEPVGIPIGHCSECGGSVERPGRNYSGLYVLSDDPATCTRCGATSETGLPVIAMTKVSALPMDQADEALWLMDKGEEPNELAPASIDTLV